MLIILNVIFNVKKFKDFENPKNDLFIKIEHQLFKIDIKSKKERDKPSP